MDNFEIIDVHTHMARTHEEGINWWLLPGTRPRDRWATPESVLPYMDRYGISKMVVLVLLPRLMRPSLAEKEKIWALPEGKRQEEEQKMNGRFAPLMREFNEWGCKLGRQNSRLIPFVVVSKELGGAQAMADEVALRFEQGAKGVKIHPGIFSHYPDDKELWPMYQKCQELGLPVLADSGPWDVPHVLAGASAPLHVKSPDFGEPKNFARVLEDFPRLTLVLAHLGSAWWDERVELAQKYPNVYFDTAQGFSAPDRVPHTPHRGLAEEDAVRIFRKIGVERILFGSDGPAIPMPPQLEQFLRLPLTDEEKRMILSENAKRILHI